MAWVISCCFVHVRAAARMLRWRVPFMVLAGISLGFPAFNRYPASIFMGGTGSFALGVGYVTAVMLTDMVCFGVLALSVPIVLVVVSLSSQGRGDMASG